MPLNPISVGEAIVAAVKTVPRALKASEAVNQAKSLEGQIAKILDKPKVTAADVKKAETLAKKADDILSDSGASKKVIADVKNGIKSKVEDVKSEVPVAKTTKPTVKAPTADAAKAQADAKAAATTPAKTTKVTTTVKKAEEPVATTAARESAAAKAEKILTKEEAPAVTRTTGKSLRAEEEGPSVVSRASKAEKDAEEGPSIVSRTSKAEKDLKETPSVTSRLSKAERDGEETVGAKTTAKKAAEEDLQPPTAVIPPGVVGIIPGEIGLLPPDGGKGGGGDGGDGVVVLPPPPGDGGVVPPKVVKPGENDVQPSVVPPKGPNPINIPPDEPPPPPGDGSGGGGGGGGGGGDNPPAAPAEDTFENTWLILRAKLLALGLPVKTVDDSVSYFRNIIKDGKFSGTTDEIGSVVDQYLYLPTYTAKSGEVIQSPFYRDFGKYNESLQVRKKPGDLVSLVLGYQQLVDKYAVNTEFKSEKSITEYLKNDVSVSELDERMNAARLRGLNADPNYIATLKQLGYISGGQDLTDFFLDPKIGTMQLESNRKTAAFATEAIRRSNANIALDKTFATQQASRLAALGYSEAQITNLASQGYQNIAEELNPVVAYSGMFEKTGQDQTALSPIVQQELQQEEFMNMASARRKKLSEQYVRSLQGQSGTGRFSISTGGTAGMI